MRLLQREVAGDDTALVDGGVDLGAGDDLLIEHDRQKAPLVGGSVGAEDFAPLLGQSERDEVLPQLIGVHARLAQAGPGQDGVEAVSYTHLDVYKRQL